MKCCNENLAMFFKGMLLLMPAVGTAVTAKSSLLGALHFRCMCTNVELFVIEHYAGLLHKHIKLPMYKSGASVYFSIAFQTDKRLECCASDGVMTVS